MSRRTIYVVLSFVLACVALSWVDEALTGSFTAIGFVRVSCTNEPPLLLSRRVIRQFSAPNFRDEVMAACANEEKSTCGDVCCDYSVVTNASWEVADESNGSIRLSVSASSRKMAQKVAETYLHIARQFILDENASLVKASTAQFENNLRRARTRLERDRQSGTPERIAQDEIVLKKAAAEFDKVCDTTAKNLIQVNVIGPVVAHIHGRVFSMLNSVYECTWRLLKR